MRNGAIMTNLESYLKKRGITEKQMEEAREQTEALASDDACCETHQEIDEVLLKAEMETYHGIVRGYEQYLNGEVTPAEEVFTKVRAGHGWDDR